MLVGFGKHKAKEEKWVLLNDPGYRTLTPNPTGPLAGFVARANAFIAHFDGLPLLVPCSGKVDGQPCTKRAQRATAYTGHSGLGADLCFWCESCDPTQAGAFSGNLTLVRSYSDVVTTAGGGSGRKDDQKRLLKQLARAKLPGQPKKFMQAQLDALFGP